MKTFLIILGSLGAIYAVFGIVRFLQLLVFSTPVSTYGVASLSASVLPVCIGLIVCLACFQRAFRKPPAK